MKLSPEDYDLLIDDAFAFQSRKLLKRLIAEFAYGEICYLCEKKIKASEKYSFFHGPFIVHQTCLPPSIEARRGTD